MPQRAAVRIIHDRASVTLGRRKEESKLDERTSSPHFASNATKPCRYPDAILSVIMEVQNGPV
jgi:hypothetical protein